MLSVVYAVCHFAECHIKAPYAVVMLNVIMMSVVAPTFIMAYRPLFCVYRIDPTSVI
jgi:hypothetical protein